MLCWELLLPYRGNSHCCQQTRLMIWWGGNIFHVTVCKHCSFHSKPSLSCTHTLMHLYEPIFFLAVDSLCLPFLRVLRMCWQGPCWTSKLISKAHHILFENVNRHIHILCQCIRLPWSQRELHCCNWPGAQEVTVGENPVIHIDNRHIY